VYEYSSREANSKSSGWLPALLPQFAKFIPVPGATACDRVHFHEEVAHFFRGNRADDTAAPHTAAAPSPVRPRIGLPTISWDQKKREHTAAFFGWHTRKLAQRQVTARIEPKQRNVCDYSDHSPVFQFGKQQFASGITHSPAFGVQHLTERGRARTFLVEDQDVHLLRLSLKRGAILGV